MIKSGQSPGQLGSPQWQHRSPLPICSPAHAYMAGQTSPPGALGARLRDLEPKQVLPALRALWYGSCLLLEDVIAISHRCPSCKALTNSL